MEIKTLKKGAVYWITGLSGAGKTTIARHLYDELYKLDKNLVFLDGDTLRKIFGNGLGHTVDDRKKLAMSYAGLCKALSDQGINVICATISLFHECQDWNRKNIFDYKEIYLQAPMEVLRKRDKKQLYGISKNSKTAGNVVGIDIKMEEPKNPDIVICNDGSKLPEDIAKMIVKKFCSA